MLRYPISIFVRFCIITSFALACMLHANIFAQSGSNIPGTTDADTIADMIEGSGLTLGGGGNYYIDGGRTDDWQIVLDGSGGSILITGGTTVVS